MARMTTLRRLRSDYDYVTRYWFNHCLFHPFFPIKSDTAPDGRVAISQIHECESLFIAEMHLAALA